MRTHVRLRGATALAAALAVASCGSDSTGPSALTPAASLEIASQLMFSIVGMGFIGAGVTADGEPAILAEETISETVPCEAGGTVTVEGTFGHNLDEQGTGTFAYDLRQRPNDCGMQTSQGVFRVTGSPHLQLTANVTTQNFQLVGVSTWTFVGGFTFTGSGGTGSCQVNMAWSINWQAPEQTAVTGSMCGHPLG